jgi:hypothetical protein
METSLELGQKRCEEAQTAKEDVNWHIRGHGTRAFDTVV